MLIFTTNQFWESNSVVFKVWFLDRELQHHLETALNANSTHSESDILRMSGAQKSVLQQVLQVILIHTEV
jgi:hypothetical protein